MKVVSLNLGNFGSTGGIAEGICAAAKDILGWESYCAFPNSDRCKSISDNSIIIQTKLGWKIKKRIAYYTSRNGMVGYFSTKRFLKKLKRISPDVLHLHNLHNSYIHLPMLFKYIKDNNINVVWTLHDCWAFTGHCPYFTMAQCEKWQTGCFDCPSYRQYPESYFDDSKRMYELKKKWFTGVKNLTIVTPSRWLGDLVKQSYLSQYAVKVINNGIDLSVFKPTQSEFRKKYGIPEEKKILLGVAYGWGKRKGLDVFVELEKRLDKRKYHIVLVGTNDMVDKLLPESIISIHRTHDHSELAEIYTTADLFVNPTREEVWGLVNVEALACGTPVVTFRTGGSPECIDETCGSVVDCGDIDALEKEIYHILEEQPYPVKACLKKAAQFDKNARFAEYVRLYEEISHAK